jgi:hypothetical protein
MAFELGCGGVLNVLLEFVESSLLVSGSTSTGIGMVIATGSYSFTGSTLTGLTIDPQGNIYAAARTQNDSSIIKVSSSGAVSALAIPNNITPALNNPQGVAADAMGNIYIVDSIASTNPDTTNSRIVKITTAGVASILSLSGQASSLSSSGLGYRWILSAISIFRTGTTAALSSSMSRVRR